MLGGTRREPTLEGQEGGELTTPDIYEHHAGQRQNTEVVAISSRRGGVYEGSWNHARSIPSRPIGREVLPVEYLAAGRSWQLHPQGWRLTLLSGEGAFGCFPMEVPGSGQSFIT